MAQKAFAYRGAKYVGAYAAAMNGVDVICFTAGVGENDGRVRELVMEKLTYLGIENNREVNAKSRGVEVEISPPESKVACYIVPTNEELAICRETVALI